MHGTCHVHTCGMTVVGEGSAAGNTKAQGPSCVHDKHDRQCMHMPARPLLATQSAAQPADNLKARQ